MTSKEAEEFLSRTAEQGVWFSLLDAQGEPLGPDIVDHAEIFRVKGRDMLNVRLAGYERDAHLNHVVEVTAWEEGWDTCALDGVLESGQKFRLETVDRVAESGLHARMLAWKWKQKVQPELYRTASELALQEAKEMAGANSSN